jgi:hypothetical protein
VRVSECATAREQLICQVLTKFLPIQSLLYWLKTALRSTLCRDPLDAAHDSEILAQLLGQRCDGILSVLAANVMRPLAQLKFKINPHVRCPP